MKFYETKGVHIKSWCNNPEQGAIDQAIAIAELPFIFSHVALMPDTHQGFGMPIGGVIGCKGVVIPNAVGVDIGCGMLASKTSLKEISIEQLKAVLGGSKEFKGGIRGKIPVGFNHHKKDQTWYGFDNVPDIDIIKQEIKSAHKQLGTLGGGNHFIEIQKGNDGYVWIMIHSGSRNLGYKIAKHYNDLAQKLCAKWHSNIPKPKGQDGLAFLPVDTQEGQDYITAMNYSLDFALENRLLMFKLIRQSFEAIFPDIKFEPSINIHHNYASLEHHFGHNVWVHRKGATSAREGQLGIIPGSQGSSSYIVIGKGNPNSFMSCSHGAGRALSRTKAIETLDLASEQSKMEGIIHSVRCKSNLDESVSAYKNIDIVMGEQSDLVDIAVKLRPLAVVKG